MMDGSMRRLSLMLVLLIGGSVLWANEPVVPVPEMVFAQQPCHLRLSHVLPRQLRRHPRRLPCRLREGPEPFV